MTWGSGNFTQFMDRVHSNQKANFVNIGGDRSVLIGINDCFAESGKSLGHATPLTAALFLLRAQYAYKAALSMALAGQVVETFAMTRSVLEYAGYALARVASPRLGVSSVKVKTSSQVE